MARLICAMSSPRRVCSCSRSIRLRFAPRRQHPWQGWSLLPEGTERVSRRNRSEFHSTVIHGPGYVAKVNLLDRQTPLLPDVFTRWFASRGWRPRAHQLELLAKAQAGRSALLIAPTGGGKTLAGFLPSLVELSTLYLSLPAGTGRHTEGVAGEGESKFLPDGHA